jgi:hypothetical protein
LIYAFLDSTRCHSAHTHAGTNSLIFIPQLFFARAMNENGIQWVLTAAKFHCLRFF